MERNSSIKTKINNAAKQHAVGMTMLAHFLSSLPHKPIREKFEVDQS